MIEKMGKGLKIFLLDDEEDICYFFKEVLVRRGFEVQMARTGTAAVDVIKNFEPHIAVLDVHLAKGKMDGIDVLRVIREQRPNCKCIMVTVADDEKTIKQAKDLGAIDYLVKPLTIDKVEAAINKLVKQIRKGAK